MPVACQSDKGQGGKGAARLVQSKPHSPMALDSISTLPGDSHETPGSAFLARSTTVSLAVAQGLSGGCL